MKNNVIVLVFLFIFSDFSVADQMVLSGEGGESSGVSLSCTSTTDGVQLTYSPGVLVRTSKEGSADGFVFKKTGKVYIMSPVPEGTEIAFMGLGSDWGSMSANVNKVDMGKSLGHAVLVNGVAVVTIPFVKKDGRRFTHAMLNVAAKLPNGTQAWGGVTDTVYSVTGKHGPFFLVPQDCSQPGSQAVAAAKQIESRR